MGLFSRVKNHFVRKVVKDNSGLLPELISGGVALAGLLGGKGDDISLQDQRTPEAIANQKLLSQIALTGQGGGIDLTKGFTGDLGNFDISQAEQSGLSQLLAPQQQNQNITGAADIFSRLGNAGLSSDLIDSFRKESGKSLIEGDNLLNRESAITGSRFGTGLLDRKADLQSESEDVFQKNLLSALFQQQGINLQAAGGLANVGQAQFGQEQQNLLNKFNFGGRQRDLDNQEAQAKFNQFLTVRDAENTRLDIASGAANRNPNLGISSIPGSPSPFSQLINSVLGSVGAGAGEQFGKNAADSGFSSAFKGLFQK